MGSNFVIKNGNPLKKLTVGNWLTMLTFIFLAGGTYFKVNYTEKRVDKLELKHEKDYKELNEKIHSIAINFANALANRNSGGGTR